MIWGSKISADMDKSIRILLIVTGVKSSQIMGHGDSIEDIRRVEMESESDIKFIQ